MQVIHTIINECLKNCISNDLLDCAYLDKKFELNDQEINVYFIFKESFNLQDLTNIVNKYISIVNVKIMNNSLEVICENGFCFSFFKVMHIYNFLNLCYIYNPNNLEVSHDFTKETENSLILALNEFISNIKNVYKFKNNILSNILSYTNLVKANESLLIFLKIFYTKIPYYSYNSNYNLDLLYKKLEEDSALNNYLKISKMLNINSIDDCLNLLIWFMDEYISRMPISIAYNINMDYYLHVKNIHSQKRK